MTTDTDVSDECDEFAPRTALRGDPNDNAVFLDVPNATYDVGILFDAEWTAPRVVVLHAHGHKGKTSAQWYNLSDVLVDTHEWNHIDGRSDGAPRVELQSLDWTDLVLIEGVARGMVAIDRAPFVENSPRLLIYTDSEEYPTHFVPV